MHNHVLRNTSSPVCGLSDNTTEAEERTRVNNLRSTACRLKLESCAGRGAAADNLCAPPPTFVDRRAAAPDNLSARRGCYCCCVLILLQFSKTKKGHLKM